MKGLLCLLTGLLGLACAATIQVKCGDVITLRHVQTGRALQVPAATYANSSIHVVSLAEMRAESLWYVVRTDECPVGTPIDIGDSVVLLNLLRQRGLKVLPGGANGLTPVGATADGLGGWRVESAANAVGAWEYGARVRLVGDGGVRLFAHDAEYPEPLAGHYEVGALGARRGGTTWTAAAGAILE